MLSGAAIFVSVVAFLIVLFVMNGMNASIADRLLALEPHLVLGAKTDPAKTVTDTEWVRAALGPQVTRIMPYELQDVILRSFDGQFRGAQSKGITEEALRDFLNEVRRLSKRKTLEDESFEMQDGDIVIGIDLARSLNLFEGDTVLAMPPESLLLPSGEAPRMERLRVRRILSTQLSDLDAKLFLYVRGKAFRSFQGSPSRTVGVEMTLVNARAADAAKAALLKSIRKDLFAQGILKAETWSERNSALFFALRMEKLLIGLFLGLAALIAGSSILGVMTLLISQKRRDIALLRVMGLSQKRTVALFMRIGIVLAGGAVVAGAVVGTGVGLWIEAYPLNVLPDIYYDSEIPAQFDAKLLLFTLLAAAGLVGLGSWFPARTVSDIEPAQVLRQKN